MDKRTVVKEKVVSILNAIRPDIDLEKEAELISDGILESIDIVEIVAQLEEEMGILLPPSELTEENFRSLDTIVEMAVRIQGD